ncbi:MAG: LytTR family DNA-binding domain-containing protein [candidate division KSB1 bacterium]|nr:LytTR family DNA-binding domain-containing protein [candidate division KSB1 bacterium]
MIREPRRFRSVIVDDEWLVRAELERMLRAFPEIEVVGQAENVAQAVQLVQEKRPDVIFLDIQMPGESGFELLDRINVDCKVIFVTAYDQYALRAFEVNALDYLLKPVTTERLAKAIQRLHTRTPAPEPPRTALDYNDVIYVLVSGTPRFVKVSLIKCITAAGNYSYLLYGDRRPELVPKTLSQWEEILPKSHFVRIHRSAIVNFEYVREVKRGRNYNYLVFLQGVEKPLTLSRRYAARLKKTLFW